ncbi:dinuclear metal center YbgI/SA1388 family protein [Caldalkalibacillus uzonensis]|uniref:GTP cyclohydrolase 1 type 2 homolog n=1 Tax=Caldalkalibacillus uzonensis TaxID=353224 RepID=A0ABU0CU61_9BACI|nr:Nif3-like dinuclear metal center hexameric protein [Caldalkalibacillus uzonensis]MDQ0339657.1 dinuclear metal center YbgI/SA1388 family protein [Caldalkalibacillus uzonensis]
MSVHAQTVIQWLEQFAPKSLAVEKDPIGLQIGTLNKKVNKVLITLDVTPAVVEEAIAKGAGLIIAHHPPVFRPLAHLRTDLPQGKVLARLLQHDIAVYAAHTNLDVAPGGLNDWLAQRLELSDVEVLAPTQHETLKKLMVFVPRDHEAQVRQALGDAGAGHIGNYSHCTFRTDGIGTFKPGEGTNPFIGSQGEIEQVEEVKIETIFPASIEKQVIQAMIKAHPYEEVAYDIYQLDQPGEARGLGRIGYLKQEISLQAFAAQVKEAFDVPFCRVVGPLDAPVKKVAVLGGDGNKYVQQALFKGADVLVTGDVYFHTAQDALMAGLKLVDPGHHAEKVMIRGLQQVLTEKAKEHKVSVDILSSEVNTDPFQMI